MKLICFAVVCLGITLPMVPDLQAQEERPSHDFGDRTLPATNIPKYLDMRRNQGRAGGAAFDNDLMKKLVENFGGMVDPGKIDPELVRKFIQNNPEFRDPKNLERIKEIVDKQMKENPEQWDPKKIQNAIDRVEDLRKKNDDVFRDPDPKKERPEDPRPMPPKPPEDKKPDPREDKQAAEVQKWMKKNFGDSPAVQKISKDIGNRIAKGTRQKFDWLPKFNAKKWNPLGDWSKRKNASPKSEDISIPNRPKVNTDSSTRTSSSSSSSSRPRNTSTSSTSSSSPRSSARTGNGGSGSGWFPLLILTLLVVGGILIWYRYFRNPTSGLAGGAVATGLPPIDIGTIECRADVVAVFEAISVQKCGEEARNWHHHEIARKLTKADPDHDLPANRLARLYEKARYAPADEPFRETDLAAARENSRILANEPSA